MKKIIDLALLNILIFLVLGFSNCTNRKQLMANKLKSYKEKRDFNSTPEPKPKTKKINEIKKIFVIQKHDASKLHYDFRLEIDGVLVSWAIPKGPSLNPADKRLAVMTEDHPLEYGRFEGLIPEGNYGAGPVMIWDTGSYTNIKKIDGKTISMKDCLKEGSIEIELHGKKLNGAFALIHMKGKGKNWLLIKMNDEYASKTKNPVKTQTKSALTNRSMVEIKKA